MAHLGFAKYIIAVEDYAGDLSELRTLIEHAMFLWSADDKAVAMAAIMALRDAAGSADKAILDDFARRYATHFTAPELHGILAYSGGPAGKARRRNRMSFNAHSETLSHEHGYKIALEARRLFCAEWDCKLPPTPAPPRP